MAFCVAKMCVKKYGSEEHRLYTAKETAPLCFTRHLDRWGGALPVAVWGWTPHRLLCHHRAPGSGAAPLSLTAQLQPAPETCKQADWLLLFPEEWGQEEPKVGLHGENTECCSRRTDVFRIAPVTMETTVAAGSLLSLYPFVQI